MPSTAFAEAQAGPRLTLVDWDGVEGADYDPSPVPPDVEAPQDDKRTQCHAAGWIEQHACVDTLLGLSTSPAGEAFRRIGEGTDYGSEMSLVLALSALALTPSASRSLGYDEAPNEAALWLARKLIFAAARYRLLPFRIAPSANDSVSVWFRCGPCRVSVDFFNTNEIAYLLKPYPRGEYTVGEVEPTDRGIRTLLDSITGFFATAPWGSAEQ